MRPRAKEEIDDEEDALEYDFEGKYAEAELEGPFKCSKKGEKCVMPLDNCCGYNMKCKGKKGNKTCQCTGIDKVCYTNSDCCTNNCQYQVSGGRICT